MSYSEKILSQIELKVKEVCLRTYILTYGSQYKACAVEDMVEMFEIEKETVYKLISKMIIYNQVQGAWDQPSQCIVMHSVCPSRLQQSALSFSDKVRYPWLFLNNHEFQILSLITTHFSS